MDKYLHLHKLWEIIIHVWFYFNGGLLKLLLKLSDRRVSEMRAPLAAFREIAGL